MVSDYAEDPTRHLHHPGWYLGGARAVQYHPEGAPGPLDLLAVFDRIVVAALQRRDPR